MKIAVTTILGDGEERHVERWLKTTAAADVRVVVDCAKKSAAGRLLRIAGVFVPKFTGHTFRFDEARNQGLKAIPKDVDIVMTNDMDELIVGDDWADGVRDAMSKAGSVERRLQYNYIHSFDPETGNPSKVFLRDAIHMRNGYAFKYAAHEVLVADHPTELVFVNCIEQHHLQHLEKPRNYLPLLELTVKENPDDPHARYNFLREVWRQKNWSRFRQEFAKYEAMPTKIHYQHMALLTYLAEVECVEASPQSSFRLHCLQRATEVCPALREGWIDLADAMVDREDFKGAKDALEKALEIQVRAPLSVVRDKSWSSYPLELLAFVESRL